MDNLRSLWTRCLGALSKVSVEPFLFFVMFGYNVRLFSLQSLLHDRSCRVTLAMPANVCDHLHDDEHDSFQNQAIQHGNNIYNGIIVVSTLPAIIIATFLGPWSDRYSRKIPMMLACSGILIDSSMQAFVTALPDASPYWFLACCTASGLTGGIIIIISSTYSYMSDITNEKSRQMRFAILEFFSLMATPIGSYIGGRLYTRLDYFAVMTAGACCMATALIWLIFLVRETKPKVADLSTREMLRDVIRLDNLKESYGTCVKERPGNLRLQIWLLILVGCSLRFVAMGNMSIA